MIWSLITLTLAVSASALKLHPNGNKEWCLTGNTPGFSASLDKCGAQPQFQDWVWKQDTGQWQIAGTGTCLAPNDSVGAGEYFLSNGAGVRLEMCGYQHHEKWNPGPYDGTSAFDTTVECASGKWCFCLDNADGALESGNVIQVWKCSGEKGWAPQTWTLGS